MERLLLTALAFALFSCSLFSCSEEKNEHPVIDG